MQHDATLSPAMLDLRMNYRNILKELQQYDGRLVSHQFALMQPRRRNIWEQPKGLQVPEGCDRALYLKVATRRAQEASARAAALRAALESQADTADEASRPPTEGSASWQEAQKGAAELSKINLVPQEVQELMADNHVILTHSALEDPPNSGRGLPQGRLLRALQTLGYKSQDPNLLKSALRPLFLRPEDNLDLEQFCHVALAFKKRRLEELREQFERLDKDDSGAASAQELRHFLSDLGYSVSWPTVYEIFEEADRNNSGQIEFEEFELVLQILHERQGFSSAEVEELYALFDRYDIDRNGELGAEELVSVLGSFGAPTATAEARTIISKLSEDNSLGLCRPEFLVIMRSRLENEIVELRSTFGQFDRNCTGALTKGQLMEMVHGMGYSILPEALEDAKKELSLERGGMGYIFEDVLRIVQLLRKREGFSASEADELLSVYRMFDGTRNRELREFELARAINWLGYPLSQSRRRQLWCKIDVDRTDSIDEHEFLKLARLLREEESFEARQMLSHLSDTRGLPQQDLKMLLVRLGYAPPKAVLDKAVQESLQRGWDTTPDLPGMLSILRYVREEQVAKLRLSAGISDLQATRVRSKFALKLEAGKVVEAAELEKFMNELFKVSPDDPRDVGELERIHSVVMHHASTGPLGLTEMFWCVRHFGDMREEDLWRREQAAAEASGFSTAEVAQLRNAFVRIDADGSNSLSVAEAAVFLEELERMASGGEAEQAVPPAQHPHQHSAHYHDMDSPKLARLGSAPAFGKRPMLARSQTTMAPRSEIVEQQQPATPAALTGQIRIRLTPAQVVYMKQELRMRSLTVSSDIDFPEFITVMAKVAGEIRTNMFEEEMA